MNRIALVSAIALLSACSGGIQMPDFRGGGSSAPEVMEAPVTEGAVTIAPEGNALPSDVANAPAKVRFVAAMEAAGCVLSPTNVSSILANAQLGLNDFESVVNELDAEGVIAGNEADKSLRLTSENCPAA